MKNHSSSYIVAKKHPAVLQLQVSAFSSMMLLATSSAFSADNAKKPVSGSLSTVKVTADASDESFKADKLSSEKFTQPLIDVPQTVVVLKKELFQQQAASTLSETLRNTPGITLLMGENGNTATGDSIFMRGFDTQGSIFVDGIRDLGSITRDTFNTEQVEIAKGPAGVDNGRGAASGYINLNSKVASLEEATSGNLSIGSGNYKRASLDTNYTLGESSAIRVNLLKQDADVVGRDEVENNMEGLAISLATGLGSKTRIYLNQLSMKQTGIPDGGIPTIGLKGFYDAVFDPRPSTTYKTGGPLARLTPQAVDTTNFYGSTNDYNDVNANMTTLRIEHDLAENMKLRNTSRFGRTQQDMVLTGVNGITAPAAHFTNPDVWLATRTRQGRDQTNQIMANQTNLSSSFDVAGLKHELSAGFELMNERQSNYTLGTPWQTTKPELHLVQDSANLYHPDTQDNFQPVIADGQKTDGETSTTALYALDTISINEHWELSAGFRAERFHTSTESIIRQGKTTAPLPQTLPIGTLLGRSAEVTDELLSWKLGSVYKPASNGSVYVSYATSQLPPGGTNFALNTDSATINANSPNLEPQKATNKEIGTKWNVYNNKLSLTAAIFQSTNTNEVVTNPDTSVLPLGEREVQGVEFGVAGIVMQNWQISAGLAFMQPEIKKGSSGSGTTLTQLDGGSIQWSPEKTFTLWSSYTFREGFTLAGGARYMDTVVSSSIVDPARLASRSLVTVPDYWVFDAMAAYEVNQNISLQLNLLNLGDETYLAGVNNGGSRYSPSAPRSVRLGMNFTF